MIDSLIDNVFLPHFQAHGQSALYILVSAKIPKMCFLSKYKSLPQIEILNKEDKNEWRKLVNEMFPNTTPEFRLNAIKIIYTIGTLTN